MGVRRAVVPLVIASGAMGGLQWAQVGLGVSNRASGLIYLVLLPVNIAVTLAFPRGKARVVRFVQRWVLNPPMRWLLHLGIMPLGLAMLETRGRKTGRPRRTPVGKGMIGGTFWLVAEHGMRAGYVRNIQADPRVRIRMRVGLRFRWVSGTASLRPELDPATVQRRLAAWHPLRAFNAMQVQVLGSSLLVVRIDLDAESMHGESERDRVPVTAAADHSPG